MSTQFDYLVNEAVRSASAYQPFLQPAIVASRLLPALMVPAWKNVASANQMFRIYTHQNAITTLGVAAGDIGRATIMIGTQADFLWTAMAVTNGATGNTQPSFDLQLTFGGSDQAMVNRANGVHVHALLGTLQGPATLPKAMVLRRNQQIQVTVTTCNATALANVFVWLVGVDYRDVSLLDSTRQE